MSYDINVLVVQQEKRSTLPFTSKIMIDDYSPRYDGWRFIYEIKGIWYYLGMEGEVGFNASYICDSNFDIDEEQLPLPHWIQDEDITYHLTPLVIKEQYVENFKNILNFLIQQSPIKMILFLARYQGGESEIVQGIISLDDFFKLLNSEKVLFNTSYILREN
jgi:hypothetical protein